MNNKEVIVVTSIVSSKVEKEFNTALLKVLEDMQLRQGLLVEVQYKPCSFSNHIIQHNALVIGKALCIGNDGTSKED